MLITKAWNTKGKIILISIQETSFKISFILVFNKWKFSTKTIPFQSLLTDHLFSPIFPLLGDCLTYILTDWLTDWLTEICDYLTKARFIRRISAASNAIQTKDNEANHLIIYCLNCTRHGRNATYEFEPGLNDRPSDQLTNESTYRPINCWTWLYLPSPTFPPVRWLSDWHTNWLTKLSDFLTDWLTDWLTNWLC